MSDCEAEDEFQDAQEEIPIATEMDLETAIMESKRAINCFFNNNFEEARKIMEPWAGTSMYHALGISVFAFLEAILTFEQKHIEKAGEALKNSMHVCSKYRRHTTITQNIGKMVKKTNYDNYTNEEVHAELCYAESLLLKAMLTFVEDETLVSFVKAGLKIRSCFLSYKECLIMLNERKWDSESHKLHFESGVRLGIGTFNLMISLLPARVIKLLEFIGFSGDKEYGLQELYNGYSDRRAIRHVLFVMNLLSFNLIITPVISNSEGDFEWCEDALQQELTTYPNGVWFLFYKGRLELLKGSIDEAIEWYNKSKNSQDVWIQFHHICYWELMWAHCIKQDWQKALSYSELLSSESNWSKTIYLYQQAAIFFTTNPAAGSSEKDAIDALMMQVPKYKQRIAGKSLPMEKFVIKKCDRYFAQKKYLCLPVLELMYLWNIFKTVGKRMDLLLQFYKAIEDEETYLKSTPKNEYSPDNEALLLLLKGACLRQMKHHFQSAECLRKVLSLEKQIKEDRYIIPYAAVELALVAKDEGNNPLATSILEDAKKNYTGYNLESRLHFRIHSLLLELNGSKKSNGVKSKNKHSNHSIDLKKGKATINGALDSSPIVTKL